MRERLSAIAIIIEMNNRKSSDMIEMSISTRVKATRFNHKLADIPVQLWQDVATALDNKNICEMEDYIMAYVSSRKILPKYISDYKRISVEVDGVSYSDRCKQCCRYIRELDYLIDDFGLSYYKNVTSLVLHKIKVAHDGYLNYFRQKQIRRDINSPSLIFKPEFLTKKQWYRVVDWLTLYLKYEDTADSAKEDLDTILHGIISGNTIDDRLIDHKKIITANHIIGYLNCAINQYIRHANYADFLNKNNSLIPFVKDILRDYKKEINDRVTAKYKSKMAH